MEISGQLHASTTTVPAMAHNGAYSIVTRLQVQLKDHVLIPSKGKKFSSPKCQTNSEGCLCFHWYQGCFPWV